MAATNLVTLRRKQKRLPPAPLPQLTDSAVLTLACEGGAWEQLVITPAGPTNGFLPDQFAGELVYTVPEPIEAEATQLPLKESA